MDTREIVHTLNDLIETCKNGEHGFSICAEQAESLELKNLLATRSSDCKHAADELQTCVVRMGGEPEEHGTAAGAVHRGWVKLRAELSPKTDLAVLEECERGEDVALKHYRDALTHDLPHDVEALVQRQLLGAQANHDQIKMMRNQLRAQARA